MEPEIESPVVVERARDKQGGHRGLIILLALAAVLIIVLIFPFLGSEPVDELPQYTPVAVFDYEIVSTKVNFYKIPAGGENFMINLTESTFDVGGEPVSALFSDAGAGWINQVIDDPSIYISHSGNLIYNVTYQDMQFIVWQSDTTLVVLNVTLSNADIETLKMFLIKRYPPSMNFSI